MMTQDSTEDEHGKDSYLVKATVLTPMAVRYPALRSSPQHLVPSVLALDKNGDEFFVRQSMRGIYALLYEGYLSRLWTTSDRDEAEAKANEFRQRHAERGSDANEHYADVEVIAMPSEQALLRSMQKGFPEDRRDVMPSFRMF